VTTKDRLVETPAEVRDCRSVGRRPIRLFRCHFVGEFYPTVERHFRLFMSCPTRSICVYFVCIYASVCRTLYVIVMFSNCLL